LTCSSSEPQPEIESGQLIGFEALIRWPHASRGMIPLSTFIPVLEDMGLITDIDQRVMETAFSDFATWLEKGIKVSRIAG